MTDGWRRGARDESARSPLQGGERRGGDETLARPGEGRADRHLRVGVSHPSDDPALHRIFQVRASFDEAAGGWVAQVGEQNPNDQLRGWRPVPRGDRVRAFPTPAACLGDAVSSIVAMVDRDAERRP